MKFIKKTLFILFVVTLITNLTNDVSSKEIINKNQNTSEESNNEAERLMNERKKEEEIRKKEHEEFLEDIENEKKGLNIIKFSQVDLNSQFNSFISKLKSKGATVDGVKIGYHAKSKVNRGIFAEKAIAVSFNSNFSETFIKY